MGKRMDLAKSKGCDGIEPDNVDVYSNHNTGFHFTASDQLAYNKWLATGTKGPILPILFALFMLLNLYVHSPYITRDNGEPFYLVISSAKPKTNRNPILSEITQKRHDKMSV